MLCLTLSCNHFIINIFLFLFFSRFKLSDSNLTTQKPLGIAALSLGTLPPLQPAYVYHCLPKALSLEGNSNGRIASRVIIQEIALRFHLGRKTPYGTKHILRFFFFLLVISYPKFLACNCMYKLTNILFMSQPKYCC